MRRFGKLAWLALIVGLARLVNRVAPAAGTEESALELAAGVAAQWARTGPGLPQPD